MKITKQGCLLTVGIAACVALTGCGGSSNREAIDGTGSLSLGISDGPIHDAEKVCITFDQIEIKGVDEAPITISLDPAEKINLLEFQGANAAPLLFNEEVPAGNYEWMRLGVDASRGSNGGMGDTGGPGCDGEASYIATAGGTFHNLFVPSGDQSGLKLVRGFTVPVNGTANLTADWDLMKSIVAPPGLAPDVILKPVIRLVDNVAVGTLTGTVSSDLATAENCAPSVYVFNDGIAPNPIDTEVEDTEDPVATAMVNAQENGNDPVTYTYSVGFLLEGEYEAAFTCDGQTFEPVDGKPASIAAQQVTTVDFP